MSARMVLLGPPGAGKGTQAARIGERLGIPAISTGDIFRAHVAGSTELGRRARAYMDKGEYVPDSVTNAMVADRLTEDDAASGFLLDGYPHTAAQADDTEPVIRRRLEVYAEATAPLAAIYEGRGLLLRVDGMGGIDEVTDRIMAALAARLSV